MVRPYELNKQHSKLCGEDDFAGGAGGENVHVCLRRVFSAAYSLATMGAAFPFSRPAPIPAKMTVNSASVTAQSVKPRTAPRRLMMSRGLMVISPRLPMTMNSPVRGEKLQVRREIHVGEHFQDNVHAAGRRWLS